MAVHVFNGPRVFVNDVDISELVHSVNVVVRVDEVVRSEVELWAMPEIEKGEHGPILRFRTTDRPVHGATARVPPMRGITVREDT